MDEQLVVCIQYNNIIVVSSTKPFNFTHTLIHRVNSLLYVYFNFMDAIFSWYIGTTHMYTNIIAVSKLLCGFQALYAVLET